MRQERDTCSVCKKVAVEGLRLFDADGDKLDQQPRL